MSVKRLLVALSLIVLLGGSAWAAYRILAPDPGSAGASPYRLGKVSRGDIERSITAAGRLNALDTIDVSSQLSGQIAEVLVDFNETVRAGQPLARLDPLTFEAELAEAEARLANAKAALGEARAALPGARARLTRVAGELRRKQKLRERGLVSDRDIESARADLRIAASTLEAEKARVRIRETEVTIAEATLKQARIKLDRTTIRAPIDGIVIKRNVSPGQTVAASLQAPTLFTIARDLGKMNLDAFVDEADIGSVRAGQRVVFTVEAFPTRHFQGVVVSVRQAPEVIENVTTYTVIVAVDNADRALLPGMTAIARLVTGGKRNVLRVPNAALRFDPEGHGGEAAVRSASAEPPSARVWLVEPGGSLRPVPVETGVGDDLRTEIVAGELAEGQSVAIGYSSRSKGR